MESDTLLERLPPLAQAPPGTVPAPLRTDEASPGTSSPAPPTTDEAHPRAAARAIPVGLLLGVVLVGVWLLMAPHPPDLAAQVYRVKLFQAVGFAVWDDNWYAGHHLPGYSLVYPWLGALLGVRLLGGAAVLLSSWAFERVTLAVYGPRARWAGCCFALAAAGDLWIGRLTFALGVSFALLAVLALLRNRVLLACLLGALCAGTSPVAGVLLAFAGVTRIVSKRQVRPTIALVVSGLAVVLVLQALFPEGGWEPFAASSVFASLGVTFAFLLGLPRQERLLRMGGLLYVPLLLLSLVHTPLGSNAERYAVLLAAPLLLCGVARSGWSGPGRPRWLVGGSLCAILLWTVWGPIRQTVQAQGDPSTQASFYRPLLAFLSIHNRTLLRIEVPFTRSHWEAALLAPHVELARGWERQLDKRYNAPIESNPLSASAYLRWLRGSAVSYVALPDVPLDRSSRGEGALLRHGAPYLREVLHSAHWRVFAVQSPTALASPPARIVGLEHDSFALRFARAGVSLVRVRYTRYWTVLSGRGCVERGAEGWTAVSAPSAGVVRVGARFSLERALGLGGGCA